MKATLIVHRSATTQEEVQISTLLWDDTIGTVLRKIGVQLGLSQLPYVWISNGHATIPLSLNIPSLRPPSWDPKDLPALKEPHVWQDMRGKVLEDILQTLPQHKRVLHVLPTPWSIEQNYLFPYSDIPSVSSIETQLLQQLHTTKVSPDFKLEYNRTQYSIPLKAPLDLLATWSRLQVSSSIPFARFTDGLGNGRAKYRLLQKHNIPPAILEKLLQTNEGLGKQSGILLWAPLNPGTYASITIHRDILNVFLYLQWQLAPDAQVVQDLYGKIYHMIQEKPAGKPVLQNVHARFLTSTPLPWSSFVTAYSYLPTVFRRYTTDLGDGLDFLRISDYKPPTEDAPETHTILYPRRRKEGIQVHVYSKSSRALHAAIKWFIQVREVSRDPSHALYVTLFGKQPRPALPLPIAAPTPTRIPSSVSSSSSSSSSAANFDLQAFGGGIFLDRIKEFDPAINHNTGYARKCGATTKQQPVPLTDEEKAHIDKNFPGSYDNSIVFGSDKQHKATYICPRIWCPQSKVSLTEAQLAANNQKCPKGEDPIKLYDANYWKKDGSRPHYVDFIKTNDICLPCCYLTQPKPDNVKECTKHITENGSTDVAGPSKAAPSVTKKRANAVATYVLDKPAPLEVGRLGKVPDILAAHTVVNTVRTGIVHEGGASLPSALAHIMNIPSIAKFRKLLADKISPELFMLLENGMLVKKYTKPTPSIYTLGHARSAKKVFIEAFTHHEEVWDMCKFILGFQLVVWERMEDKVYFQCGGPLLTPDLPIVMLLKDAQYYEPISIESGAYMLDPAMFAETFARIQKVQEVCKQPPEDQLLASLHVWSQAHQLPGYKIERAYIDPRTLSVSRVELENKLYLAPMSPLTLNTLLSAKIQPVFEDPPLRTKNVTLAEIEFELLLQNLAYFGWGIVGRVEHDTRLEVVSIHSVQEKQMNGSLISVSHSSVLRYRKEWSRIARKIAAAAYTFLQKKGRVTMETLLRSSTSDKERRMVQSLFGKNTTITTREYISAWLIGPELDWYDPQVHEIQKNMAWAFTRIAAPQFLRTTPNAVSIPVVDIEPSTYRQTTYEPIHPTLSTKWKLKIQKGVNAVTSGSALELFEKTVPTTYLRHTLVASILQNIAANFEEIGTQFKDLLVMDPTIQKLYQKSYGKPRASSDIWARLHHTAFWRSILEAYHRDPWATDFDFYYLSQIADVNILVLHHKKHYGSSHEEYSFFPAHTKGRRWLAVYRVETDATFQYLPIISHEATQTHLWSREQLQSILKFKLPHTRGTQI